MWQTELVSTGFVTAGAVVRDYISRRPGAGPHLLSCTIEPSKPPQLEVYEDYDLWLQDALKRRKEAMHTGSMVEQHDASKVLLSVRVIASGVAYYTELHL